MATIVATEVWLGCVFLHTKKRVQRKLPSTTPQSDKAHTSASARHWLRKRWCSQMFVPPQSLHSLLLHWCSQMPPPAFPSPLIFCLASTPPARFALGSPGAASGPCPLSETPSLPAWLLLAAGAPRCCGATGIGHPLAFSRPPPRCTWKCFSYSIFPVYLCKTVPSGVHCPFACQPV